MENSKPIISPAAAPIIISTALGFLIAFAIAAFLLKSENNKLQKENEELRIELQNEKEMRRTCAEDAFKALEQLSFLQTYKFAVEKNVPAAYLKKINTIDFTVEKVDANSHNWFESPDGQTILTKQGKFRTPEQFFTK